MGLRQGAFQAFANVVDSQIVQWLAVWLVFGREDWILLLTIGLWPLVHLGDVKLCFWRNSLIGASCRVNNSVGVTMRAQTSTLLVI